MSNTTTLITASEMALAMYDYVAFLYYSEKMESTNFPTLKEHYKKASKRYHASWQEWLGKLSETKCDYIRWETSMDMFYDGIDIAFSRASWAMNEACKNCQHFNQLGLSRYGV